MTDYPYHINPETGRANKCYKVDNCRFGIPADQHFATAAEALASREASGNASTEVTAGQAVDPKVATSKTPSGKGVRTPADEAQSHDAKMAKLFAERNRQRDLAIGNVRTLAHRLGLNLKKRRLDPEQVIARAEAAVNDPSKPINLDPYLSWAQENLAAMEKLQDQLDKADKSYAGWSRFYRVPGGRIHTTVTCRTCNHSWEHPTEFEWLADLSGLTEKDAVEKYGPVLCTVCYPEAPPEWTDYFERAAEEKKKTRCPGSGTWDYNLETARLGHATGNWGQCEHCGQKVSITSTGKLRAHRLPSDTSGEGGGSTDGSGAAVEAESTSTDTEAPKPAKRRRGRPRKNKVNA